MSKINQSFAYDIFTFVHRPIREADKKEGKNFLERFLVGPQNSFEKTNALIDGVLTLNDPANIRADLLQYLKDHVGFTKDLNNITNNLSENDLRKLISLAVALWKQKGTEPGYIDIVRLFTGSSARVFNWFDFRWIVGETQFGESQLGDDPFLISRVGIDASEDTSNNVIDLLPFEGNSLDRSLSRNNGIIHGDIQFYNTPTTGFPQNSDKYAKFLGGVISQANTSRYDFSGDFTVEMFIRSQNSESNKTLVHKMDISGKGFKIEINKSTNEISYTISDGTTTILDSFNPSSNIDDNTLYHLALVLDRTKDGARMFFNGNEVGLKIPLGALGDFSNVGPLYLGGEGPSINNVLIDIDNFRMALNPVYDVDLTSLSIPITGFIEFREEELDEFVSDIRILDDGSLNKTLIKRILNLMRPISERLNIIYISFFDDFLEGPGKFQTFSGSLIINNDIELEIAPNSIVTTDVLNDAEYQDIFLQVNAKNQGSGAGIFSIIFFFQDINNFYEYQIDFINSVTSIHKTVTGVSSQISPSFFQNLVPGVGYIFTITTDLNGAGNSTVIKTYVDQNKHNEVIDLSFLKGPFGMKTDGITTMKVKEVEMFQIPMVVEKILPNFNE